jgi:signal peptidase I
MTMTSENTTAARRPLLALLLSLLLPGLGQWYNSQLDKGIFLFLGFAFISLPFIAWIALYLSAQWMSILLLLSLVISVGIYVYAAVDAYLTARRHPCIQLQTWQQAGVYVSAVLFAYLVVIGNLTNYIRDHLVESFYIPSFSMQPTVLKGELIFGDKRVNCPGCKYQIQRGDIALFVFPNDRTRIYIKRIIGLPGDHIEIDGHQVSVNGKSIRQGEITNADEKKSLHVLSTHRAYWEQGDSGRYVVIWDKSFEAQSLSLDVPNGRVFVLGDNRSSSHDSRKFGTVPVMEVVGKARQVWFSYDGGKDAIRWDRIGTAL